MSARLVAAKWVEASTIKGVFSAKYFKYVWGLFPKSAAKIYFISSREIYSQAPCSHICVVQIYK